MRKVDAELARSCPQDEPRWTVESIAADREWLSYLELRKTLADELAEAGGIADLLELTSRMEHEVVRNLILFSCVEFLLSRESYQDARKVVDDGAFTPRWRIAAAIAVAGCARVQSDIVLARDLIACHTEMEDRFRYTMDLWHATGDGGDLERLRKAARVLYPVERCDAFRRIAMHTCDDRDFIECIVSAEQIEDRFFREKAIEDLADVIRNLALIEPPDRDDPYLSPARVNAIARRITNPRLRAIALHRLRDCGKDA